LSLTSKILGGRIEYFLGIPKGEGGIKRGETVPPKGGPVGGVFWGHFLNF